MKTLSFTAISEIIPRNEGPVSDLVERYRDALSSAGFTKIRTSPVRRPSFPDGTVQERCEISFDLPRRGDRKRAIIAANTVKPAHYI